MGYPSSSAMPINITLGLLLYFATNLFSSGISARQGGQPINQKLITMVLPAQSFASTFFPVISFTENGFIVCPVVKNLLSAGFGILLILSVFSCSVSLTSRNSVLSCIGLMGLAV